MWRITAILLACQLASICRAADGLGLKPDQQPLFDPSPLAPPPASMDPSITNMFGQAPPAILPEDDSDKIFNSTMWQAFVLAEEAAAEGDWKRSDEILLKMHELLPGNTMLSEKAGWIYLMREAFKPSQEVWLEQFGRDPKRYDLLTLIGRCSLHQGKIQDAIKPLKLAKKLASHTLEPRYYLACAYIVSKEPKMVPDALGALSLWEMSSASYWLGADFDRNLALLGETGYLQLASYILGGGEEGSLEVKDIDHVAKQLITVSRLLNQLDRKLGLKMYGGMERLLQDAFNQGVRGVNYEAYVHISEAINGHDAEAKAGIELMQKQYPDRAEIHYYAGLTLSILEEFGLAATAFAHAAALEEDPQITIELVEALAASDQVDLAFDQLKRDHPKYPKRLNELLNRDTSSLRKVKQHPAYGSWSADLPK
jgi:tetratricopeptide (TPR) repeat protein